MFTQIINQEDNPVNVKVIGGGDDTSTGGSFEGTYEEDHEGKLVLRVIDAAPFSYNLKAKQPFSGSSNTTHTFTEPMRGFVIINDGDSDLTFDIEGAVFTVKSNEKFKEEFEPFARVEITTTSAFRAYGLGM